jgi:PPOX class probable F420-dependent enzyme
LRRSERDPASLAQPVAGALPYGFHLDWREARLRLGYSREGAKLASSHFSWTPPPDGGGKETMTMTEIPDVYLDLLLEKKAFAHLATVMPDGSPQNTPVWFDFIDGKIRVNSALGRTKVRNMKLGAKVALSIMDPDNPDRYVQLRGTVSRVRQDDVAAAHIDQLAHKYLGLDKNPYAKAGDVRVMFEISVFSVQGMS